MLYVLCPDIAEWHCPWFTYHMGLHHHCASWGQRRQAGMLLWLVIKTWQIPCLLLKLCYSMAWTKEQTNTDKLCWVEDVFQEHHGLQWVKAQQFWVPPCFHWHCIYYLLTRTKWWTKPIESLVYSCGQSKAALPHLESSKTYKLDKSKVNKYKPCHWCHLLAVNSASAITMEGEYMFGLTSCRLHHCFEVFWVHGHQVTYSIKLTQAGLSQHRMDPRPTSLFVQFSSSWVGFTFLSQDLKGRLKQREECQWDEVST